MKTTASHTTSEQSSNSEDFKDQNLKYSLSKFEYDLYHDEDNKLEKIIRVKRFANSKEEKWKIFEDNKIILTVEGSKLNNKEKEFLRTPEGVNFLILQYKNGIESFSIIKNEIKKKLK